MKRKRRNSGGAPGGWESVVRKRLAKRRKKAQRWKFVKNLLSLLLKANNLLNKPVLWRAK